MKICTLLKREKMLGGLNYIIMSMNIVPWSTVKFDNCRCLLFGDKSSLYISDKYMLLKWSSYDALVVWLDHILVDMSIII